MNEMNGHSKTGLPNGWQWIEIGKLCNVVTGNTPPKSESKNYGGDIPFIKPPQLIDKPVFDAPEKLSLVGAKKARVVPKNSVLVSCIGNLGKTAITKSEVAFNQQLNAILENEKVAGQYLFYQAQSPLFKKQLEKLSAATTVAIVNKGKFETIQIPLAPIKEQQQIVSKIEELFSELDKSIEQLKTAQQQLKVYRQSVLKWAFEGKLTNNNVKNGELPKGWEWKKLKEVGNAIDPQPSHRTPPVSADGIPYVSTKDFDFENDHIDFSGARRVSKQVLQEHLERYELQKGDFVIGKIGTIGNPVRIVLPQNYTLSANIVLIQPRTINRKFLYYFFQTNHIEREFQKGSKATTQAAFGIQKVRELDISYPPNYEQQLIVHEIESRLSVADKLEETITNSLQQAEALRQSILKKAFEGKL